MCENLKIADLKGAVIKKQMSEILWLDKRVGESATREYFVSY